MADDEAYMVSLQERHADALLNQQKRPEALAKSLENPPFNVKSSDIKDVNYQIVAKAMAACKDAEIEAIVAGLDQTNCDNLMKYT